MLLPRGGTCKMSFDGFTLYYIPEAYSVLQQCSHEVSAAWRQAMKVQSHSVMFLTCLNKYISRQDESRLLHVEAVHPPQLEGDIWTGKISL